MEELESEQGDTENKQGHSDNESVVMNDDLVESTSEGILSSSDEPNAHLFEHCFMIKS